MAFLQSVERHILRNFVYLHAIEQRPSAPDRHAGRRAAGLADQRRGRRASDSRRRRCPMTTKRGEQAAGDLGAIPDGCEPRTRLPSARGRDLRRLASSGSRDASAGSGADLFAKTSRTTSTRTTTRFWTSSTAPASGTRTRREAQRADSASDRDASRREGARLHAVRRHRRLPRRAS